MVCLLYWMQKRPWKRVRRVLPKVPYWSESEGHRPEISFIDTGLKHLHSFVTPFQSTLLWTRPGDRSLLSSMAFSRKLRCRTLGYPFLWLSLCFSVGNQSAEFSSYRLMARLSFIAFAS